MRKLRMTQPRLTALHLLEPERFADPTPRISYTHSSGELHLHRRQLDALEQFAGRLLRDQLHNPPDGTPVSLSLQRKLDELCPVPRVRIVPRELPHDGPQPSLTEPDRTGERFGGGGALDGPSGEQRAQEDAQGLAVLRRMFAPLVTVSREEARKRWP